MTIINIKMHLSFSIATSEECFKRKKKKLCVLWLVITTNLFYSDIIKRKYMQNFPITKGSYYWWDLFHLVHVWRKFAFSCQPGVPKNPWEMPTKWQRTKEGWLLYLFLERLESLLLSTAQRRALGCHFLGLEASFCAHTSVPPQSWELFLLPLFLYKTLFLLWQYMYQLPWDPSASQRSQERILLTAQLGSRKLCVLYCAWLNPAGNCSTVKYTFALRIELQGNSTAVLIAITYWGFPKISLPCVSQSISVHFPKAREVARVLWQSPAGPGTGNSWPRHFHSSAPI